MAEKNNNFVGYEYRDVTVPGDMESVYTDGYSNFGWILDKKDSSGLSLAKLKFKRDRQIPHKSELTGFQHQFDKSAREIVNLENSKGTGASRAALTIGFIGTVFMALSVWIYREKRIRQIHNAENGLRSYQFHCGRS